MVPPKPLTLSATYDPRASSPPTYFDKFTPMTTNREYHMAYLFVHMTLENLEGHSSNVGLIMQFYEHLCDI